MPNPLVAIVGSAAGSAAVGLAGANKAAKAQGAATAAQVAATDKQIAFDREVFDQQRADQAPWREAGGAAIAELSEGIQSGAFTMDDWQFQADPGYAFRQREGQKALDNSAAARGNMLSGAQLKATSRYNQEFASGEYDRAFRREAGVRGDKFNMLSGIAGTGQTSVQATNADAGAMAARVGQAYGQQGQAIATGAANQGQIAQSMYGNIAATANQGIQNYLTYKGVG